jgi:hypothetical protein
MILSGQHEKRRRRTRGLVEALPEPATQWISPVSMYAALGMSMWIDAFGADLAKRISSHEAPF